MSYCTLEEAWGSDFKKKKKTKKERYYEKQGKYQIDKSVDPNILIPEAHRSADYRKTYTHQPLNNHNSSIQGYDSTFNSYISPYQRYSQTTNQVKETNDHILAEQNKQNKHTDHTNIIRNIEKPIDQLVQITKSEYDRLKTNIVEGFSNQSDEQFNQLLLYIFTGVFYLFSLDMMYQLGKKSY